MALQYGMNITASDMKSLLEKNDKLQNGVRTWRQLFGNASLGYNAQSDALTANYSDAIAKAYQANFEQNNAIMGAGLSAGATREMLAQSRNDLHTAYETYIRNYGKDMASIAENYGKEVGTIDAALTERATNFANLYNSAYKYLSEELAGSYMTLRGNAENGAEPIYDGSNLVGYKPVDLDYMTEHNLRWLYETDEAGEYTDVLRSWDSIAHDLFNADTSLNKTGIAFFDQIFNTPYEKYTHASGERNIRGFDEWLSDTNKDLRDWWVGQDVFNYNAANTNRGTSQILTGRESTDDKYSVHEYVDMSGFDEFESKVFDSSEAAEIFERKSAFDRLIADAAAQLSDPTKTFRRGEKEKFSYLVSNADWIGRDVNRKSQETWSAYLSNVTSTKNELSTFLQDKMGSALANDFWSEHKQLGDTYDAIIKEAQKKGHYDADIVSRIDKWYKDALKQMRAYVKEHKYTGETSGL